MTNQAYKKRFSEHPAFWIVCGCVILALHYWFYLRIKELAGAGWLSSLWLGWSFAMMELSYLARRTRRIAGAQRKWTDRLASTWMLFIVIASIVLFAADAVTGVLRAELPHAFGLLLSFAFAALAVVLGVRQANTIEVVRLSVETDKLPPDVKSVRVVQMTDLHLGPWVGIKLLEQIVTKVNAAEPDVVVMTGDLADGPIEGHEEEGALLRTIRAKDGFFAVTGNHDYYDDIDGAVGFMEEAGMRVLCNEAAEAAGLLIIGVDDDAHMKRAEWNLTESETVVLNCGRRHERMFTLLLRHRPIVEPGTEGMFDLQLSGHTHGGQLFPYFNSRHIITGHDRGLKKLRRGGWLYVSNGAGFVGPPVRLLAPPEITVVDIKARRS